MFLDGNTRKLRENGKVLNYIFAVFKHKNPVINMADSGLRYTGEYCLWCVLLRYFMRLCLESVMYIMF